MMKDKSSTQMKTFIISDSDPIWPQILGKVGLIICLKDQLLGHFSTSNQILVILIRNVSEKHTHILENPWLGSILTVVTKKLVLSPKKTKQKNIFTKQLKSWWSLKTQIVTNLKKSHCDKTQKLKMWWNWKT